MTDKKSPVISSEILQLASLGIQPAHISFKNVTLQSPKYICVREEGKQPPGVAIIDTATKNTLRLPVAVDSAIMNPVSKVVALRADKNLQIYNLEIKSKMKSTQMESDVVFWKWLDPKTIAIVTGTEVFHWTMDGDAQPQKMFDRAASEGPVQIINYRASADMKWLLLGGITQNAGGIAGVLQVYNVDVKASQPTMDSHAATFATVTIDGRDKPSNLFCFTKVTPQGPRVMIIEVGVPKDQAFTVQAIMKLEEGDFPVALLPDNKLGMLFLLTRLGFLYVYEIQSGKPIHAERASQASMFVSTENDGEKGGIVAIDQKGAVRSFVVDTNGIVNYLATTLNDPELAIALAKRHGLGGADQMFKSQFARLMQANRLDEAMQLAASSPNGCLRTAETVNALRSVNGGQGLLQYFQMLLKTSKLNALESIELARPLLQKNAAAGIEHIKTWIKDNKLEPSEEFGDLLRTYDLTLALSVYLRSKVPEKVISCFLTLAAQETDSAKAADSLNKILEYAERVSFTPDYGMLVQQLMRVNRDRAREFALILMNHEKGAKIDINQAVDMFTMAGDVKNTAGLLLRYLQPRGDREEDAALQTKLLEVSLLSMPDAAKAILESQDTKFTHYDRLKIAQLCERAGLYQQALEHYTDLNDIKRVLANSPAIDPNFLLDFFGRMTPSNCLDCLRDLLKYNLQQNLRLVVEVAKKWVDYLTPEALISLFEEFKSYNGIYFFVGAFINETDKPSVVFKYIEAATKVNPPQLKEVERVCREHNSYDAKEVKEFLLQQNLQDPRALIYVCDRFGFIDELVHYLYNKQLMVFIEAYVQRMNSKAAPDVLGALLDLNAPENDLKKLIETVRPPPDDPTFVERLVDVCEKRNRLRLLKSWLEARVSEGSESKDVHNGMAKIYVETSNSNVKHFLESNKFYDSKVVGKFCESRDPMLAFLAYKRSGGECDQELIEVTNKNGFFKDQARYLVERQNQELWGTVLVENNPHRRQLIDQVIATALPESRIPEEVSSTVKAFMTASLPNELIELLERIVLHGPADGDFATNKNLQNLLILTAIKADPKRVKDYIKRLENYEGPDIAKIAMSDPYDLFEEAFFIYKKFKKGPEAMAVLLDKLNSVDRALEFAEVWDQPDVWSILGRAQLDRDLTADAIKSFLKADDPQYSLLVIDKCKRTDLYNELITFLKMARTKSKDPIVDNELIYSYAKTSRLPDLEEFINQPNVAKVQEIGDRTFNEGLYEAARILYNHVNNQAKLAVTLVKLKLYQEAVDAARKANSVQTWKQVCFACVDAQKFRLAQMCGINIIVYMDHLMDVINYYEQYAYFDEVIQLVEQGVNMDRAHQGIYTQLGILYAKYKEEKLMEHVKLFWQRLNIPTLLSVCAANLHWDACVLLYRHYEQYDNALDVLINHSASCWKHDLMKEVLNHVTSEQYYKAIDFYLTEHPMLLNDLLMDLVPKLDHTRVVAKLQMEHALPLVLKYLLHVQRDNLNAVNDAINAIYVEEENYKGLRDSIDHYNLFDQVTLALQLEKHDLLEMRRISGYLLKMNKRWERSIELYKKDQLWGDAMETAAESRDPALAESLLMFFVDNGLKECFAACLFTCYDLIRPDVVMELGWRFNLMHFAMPFMIQTMREQDDKLRALSNKLDAVDKTIEDKDAEQKQQQAQTVSMAPGMMPGMSPYLALMPAGPPSMMNGPMGGGMMGGMPPMGGYGGGYM